jgi:plasmid stability protein
MATLTVRNLEDDTRDRLRVRAARHGRSMEDEVRVILRQAVAVGDPAAIWAAARASFSGADGVELDLPDRGRDRPPPEF